MVGDSMPGKESTREDGRPAGIGRTKVRPAGVRAAIVAEKPGNAGGAKGGRKRMGCDHEPRGDTSASPGGDPGRQAGDDLWENYGAARGVWSKPMLMALEKGVKGNKWFSLIDKVVSERTFG